jgi:hypothetical protein
MKASKMLFDLGWFVPSVKRKRGSAKCKTRIDPRGVIYPENRIAHLVERGARLEL